MRCGRLNAGSKWRKSRTAYRRFLFRIGHLYLLYFQRDIQRGFVLVDEPENSLFPDFLFDLMEVYDEIVGPIGSHSSA